MLCFDAQSELKPDWKPHLHAGRLWVDEKIFVPESKVQTVIQQFHIPLLADHWGVPKVMAMSTTFCDLQVEKTGD